MFSREGALGGTAARSAGAMEAKLQEIGQGHLLEGLSAEQRAGLLAQACPPFPHSSVQCKVQALPCGSRGGQETRLASVRLDGLLAQNYPDGVAEEISFVKIDAEGHDAEIVASFVGCDG